MLHVSRGLRLKGTFLLLVVLLFFSVWFFTRNNDAAYLDVRVMEGGITYGVGLEGLGEIPENDILTFSIFRFNSSALLSRFRVKSDDGEFRIADSFSMVEDYIDILSFQGNGFGYSDFVLSTEKADGSGLVEYVINFPVVGWGMRNYSWFNDDFGVAESRFLFFRPEFFDGYYYIDFSDLNMSVFNSAYGASPAFFLKEGQLMDTYFVFGNYSYCGGGYDDFYFNILFGGGIGKNDSVCKVVYSVFDYYYREFGKPVRLKANYTVGFFPAKGYCSLSSGFFWNGFDFEAIAHEMFHLWQPGWYNCSKELLYKEGLAVFMQYHSLHELCVISDAFMEKTFHDMMDAVRDLPNLESLYYLNKSDLFELRETNPRIYYALVYYKGALIWKGIHDSGVLVGDEFRGYLRTGDCSSISDLISRFEKDVYNTVVS